MLRSAGCIRRSAEALTNLPQRQQQRHDCSMQVTMHFYKLFGTRLDMKIDLGHPAATDLQAYHCMASPRRVSQPFWQYLQQLQASCATDNTTI